MCQHCYARARFTEWPTLEGKNVLFHCANTLYNIDIGNSIIIAWKISKNKCTLHGKSFKMNATLSSDTICFCVFPFDNFHISSIYSKQHAVDCMNEAVCIVEFDSNWLFFLDCGENWSNASENMRSNQWFRVDSSLWPSSCSAYLPLILCNLCTMPGNTRHFGIYLVHIVCKQYTPNKRKRSEKPQPCGRCSCSLCEYCMLHIHILWLFSINGHRFNVFRSVICLNCLMKSHFRKQCVA